MKIIISSLSFVAACVLALGGLTLGVHDAILIAVIVLAIMACLYLSVYCYLTSRF